MVVVPASIHLIFLRSWKILICVATFSWYSAIDTADINFVSSYGTTIVLSLIKTNFRWSRFRPVTGFGDSCTSIALEC